MTELIVAIDGTCQSKLVYQLDDLVTWYKINVLTIMDDPGLSWKLSHGLGKKVMMDLKLHDTPDTIGRILDEVSEWASMATVWYDSCYPGMCDKQLSILAVCNLTSSSTDFFGRVHSVAMDASNFGISGIVTPVEYAKVVKEHELISVCPGIRMENENRDDHKIFATPREAVEAGADYIVVGRPIWQSDDPRGVVQKILEELHG